MHSRVQSQVGSSRQASYSVQQLVFVHCRHSLSPSCGSQAPAGMVSPALLASLSVLSAAVVPVDAPVLASTSPELEPAPELDDALLLVSSAVGVVSPFVVSPGLPVDPAVLVSGPSPTSAESSEQPTTSTDA